MSAAIDHRAAGIAARFRNLNGTRKGLSFPIVSGGALFGTDGQCAFYGGPCDLPDGWLLPAGFDVPAWSKLFDGKLATAATFGALARKMERGAVKGAKEWEHVAGFGEVYGKEDLTRVPQIWQCFRPHFGEVGVVSVDAAALLRFEKACRELDDAPGVCTLAPSNSHAQSPLHVFYRGRWRGILMPCRAFAVEHLEKIPAPAVRK